MQNGSASAGARRCASGTNEPCRGRTCEDSRHQSWTASWSARRRQLKRASTRGRLRGGVGSGQAVMPTGQRGAKTRRRAEATGGMAWRRKFSYRPGSVQAASPAATMPKTLESHKGWGSRVAGRLVTPEQEITLGSAARGTGNGYGSAAASCGAWKRGGGREWRRQPG
ncbi:hypothetical protein ACCO45_013883 [Purpureocillium lilacinum]|uniref:Uncharacterized protein n=1 Tax=Purpureocillium lilacinum TaxID=33203 RepID=A0ACC4D9I5_PURLI